MFQEKISLIFYMVLLSAFLPLSGYSGDLDTEVIITEQDRQYLAFSAQENHWVPISKRLSEKFLDKAAQGNIGIVVTSKRILGFSVLTDEWTSEDIKLNEKVEEIVIEGNVATMKTTSRVIGFSAHTGQWIEAP